MNGQTVGWQPSRSCCNKSSSKYSDQLPVAVAVVIGGGKQGACQQQAQKWQYNKYWQQAAPAAASRDVRLSMNEEISPPLLLLLLLVAACWPLIAAVCRCEQRCASAHAKCFAMWKQVHLPFCGYPRPRSDALKNDVAKKHFSNFFFPAFEQITSILKNVYNNFEK